MVEAESPEGGRGQWRTSVGTLPVRKTWALLSKCWKVVGAGRGGGGTPWGRGAGGAGSSAGAGTGGSSSGGSSAGGSSSSPAD
eukprot:11176038-Lingulodinium_polyedra.AAC.1